MKLSRREFIITSSAVTAALAVPGALMLNRENIKQRYEDMKAFASDKIKNLDKYALAAIAPSILTMLLYSYANEIISVFISLLLLFLSFLIII